MDKEEQKQILIDTMNQDQQDGLYEVHPGLLRYDEGEWVFYTVYYDGLWSDGIRLHPNEHRAWIHQLQIGNFSTTQGKKVDYQIEYIDGIAYAVTLRDNKQLLHKTPSIESKLDIILQEIEKIKWMIRDLDSKV
jgi:hypothetical protein